MLSNVFNECKLSNFRVSRQREIYQVRLSRIEHMHVREEVVHDIAEFNVLTCASNYYQRILFFWREKIHENLFFYLQVFASGNGN